MNPFNTYVAYRDNGAYTSERGAGKFLTTMLSTGSIGAGDEGGVINGMKVVAQDTPDMYVKVSATGDDILGDGHCIIRNGTYDYFAWLTSDYVFEIEGASQSKSRISYIVAYIDINVTFDPEDEEVESPSVLKFIEVKGEEDSVSPVPPTTGMIQDAIGNPQSPYIILAEIRISAGTSVITNTIITDRRIPAKILSDRIDINEDDLFVGGFKQPNLAQTQTKIIVTNANEATPAPIPGVQLIWLKKKS